MARRPLSRRDLRAQVEAAEARGIPLGDDPGRRSRSRSETPALRPRPAAAPRTRVVWAVCDVGGRVVERFEYAAKAEAEARVAALKAAGKGAHFVRSVKEPIEASGTSSPE